MAIATEKDTQSPMSAVLERCEMNNAAVGLSVYQFPSGPTLTVHLSDSIVTANLSGVENNGGQLLSFRNKIFTGNGTDGPVLPADSFK